VLHRFHIKTFESPTIESNYRLYFQIEMIPLSDSEIVSHITNPIVI